MENIVRTLIASISQEISVRMSFLDITDAKKRDKIVADYVATIRKIKERNENEKLVGLSKTAELEQTFQPIIKSQEASTEKISQAIAPLKEKIQNLDKSSLEYEEGSQLERLIHRIKIGDKTVDSTFGITFTNRGAFIGKTPIRFEGDDIIIEGRRYPGTEGLWILITDTTKEQLFLKPKVLNKVITDDDCENYIDILNQTHVLHVDSDPNNKPKASRLFKWTDLLSDLYKEQKDEKEFDEAKGDGIFLPGDIKGLKSKLNLLLAEFRAGNTTTRNEIVFILDELRRRKQMSKKEYKEINNFLQ